MRDHLNDRLVHIVTVFLVPDRVQSQLLECGLTLVNYSFTKSKQTQNGRLIQCFILIDCAVKVARLELLEVLAL